VFFGFMVMCSFALPTTYNVLEVTTTGEEHTLARRATIRGEPGALSLRSFDEDDIRFVPGPIE
jgi:hypothetical protein